MKRYILIILSLSWIFCACDEFIDDNPNGTQLIPESVDDLGTLLDDWRGNNSINAGLSNVYGFDNHIEPATPTSQAHQNMAVFAEYIYSSTENDFDWNNLYHSIYLCNYVYEHIDKAPEGLEKKFNRDHVKGGALMHRAYSYFLLVNEYAKHYNETTANNDPGVPLLLKADINEEINERASVAAVYNQIINDLNEAVKLLPESDNLSYRASRIGAYGALARIYLYKGDFENAWKNAKMVTDFIEPIDYNTIKLNLPGDPRSGYKNMETQWFKRKDVIYSRVYPSALPYSRGSNGFSGSANYIEKLNFSNDLRDDMFLIYGKFLTIASTNQGIEAADAYLIQAEAMLRDDQSIENVRVVFNKFRKTRYDESTYTEITLDDKELLKQEILLEKRREFMARGLTLFELKRLAVQDNYEEDLVHNYYGDIFTLPAGDPKFVLPIPLNVISKNGIEQNPR
jgi:hypothetical protein